MNVVVRASSSLSKCGDLHRTETSMSRVSFRMVMLDRDISLQSRQCRIVMTKLLRVHNGSIDAMWIPILVHISSARYPLLHRDL